MQNKFLLLKLFFGLIISKIFVQVKIFITLFILLLVHFKTIGQDCITYPEINGAPCIFCVPTGWTAIGSPDIGSFGGGPSPCVDNIGVSGPSPSGGNFVSLCTNNAGYSEGMSTIINNLTPCQSYTFGIWWEETIWCNVWNNPGTLLITVQGEQFIFSGATTWELAQVCFTAQSTSVEISVRAFFNGVQHCLIVDGSPECSELSPCQAPDPCCSLVINVDQSHEICPGTSINLNALAQNATGNIQVEWTSIPATGVNFLNDPNILNPIFTFPNGDFDGETFNFLLTVTDDLCTKTKEVEVIVLKSEIPTFDFNICELSDPSVFPTTSNNGYDGTWTGNFNFSSLAGTNASYTFTLASNEENCIRQANYNIEIIEAISVLFDLETSFCLDDDADYILPSTSENLVNGMWNVSEFSPATLGPGNFSFQFTPESQFCALPYSHNISIQLKPEVAISGVPILDCKNQTTQLQAFSTVGAPVQFSWTLPGQGTVSGSLLTVSAPGLYQANAQGENGCIGTDTIRVELEKSQFVYEADTSGLITCNKNVVDLFLNLGSQIDSVSWEGPSILSQNTEKDTILVNAVGYYVFELFIGKDCSVRDSILVSQAPPEIDYALTPQDTITCIKKSVLIAPDSLNGVVNIQWLGSGSNSGILEVSKAGTYSFILFDKNGCTASDSLKVEENLEKPMFVVTVDTINCITNLGGFNITDPGYLQFVWSGEGKSFIGINPVFDKPGIYTVTATGLNGCTETQNLDLPSSIDFPKISETIIPITCANPNGSIQLLASITSTFTWNSSSTNGTGSIITSNTGGSFDIIATSSKGCTSTIQLSIPVDTLRPQIKSVADILLTCKNPEHQLILDVSSYDVYSVNGPGLPNLTSVLPTLTEKGIYTLNVKNNQNGCTNSIQFNVNEDKKKPKFAAVVQDLSCKNPSSSLNLSGDSGLEFDIDGQKITNGFLITSVGKYTIKATNSAGCDTTVTLDVKGNFDLPLISLSPILLNCNKPQQWIKDQGPETGLYYTWETDNDTIVADSVLVTQNSNITLVATNNYGCLSKLKADIKTDFIKPTITIDGPRSIPCNVSSVTLTGITTATNTLWTWSDNTGNLGNENTFKVNNTGTYTILVKNLTNGCTETTTVTIDKQSTPEDFTIDLVQPLCFGDQGSLTWTGTTGGTAPYSLSINNNNTVTLNKKSELPSGRFTLYLKDVNGCDLEKLIEIESPKDFLVNAGKDTIIQLGASHKIEANSDVSWSEITEIQWEPSTALSCTDCPDPIATPETTTEYTIIIKDKNGCIRNDKVVVRVKFNKGYVAPNIFYPGSSNGNQRFTLYPEYASIQNIKTLKVYDRWGNLVFATQNIPAGDANLGWDGSFDGREINPGVFIWVAELEYKDKSSEIVKGDITIIH